MIGLIGGEALCWNWNWNWNGNWEAKRPRAGRRKRGLFEALQGVPLGETREIT